MKAYGIVKRNIHRADASAVEALSHFGVATIHEAMGRIGLMKTYMRPIYTGAHLCGPAVTVLLQPGDNWMMHVVAEQIVAGDVVDFMALVTDCVREGFAPYWHVLGLTV
jgi:4-hydroxy-4-methyl-2-oxoglutarate aldolase